MAPPRHTLKLETLEARDVPSASPLGDFVGVVRDGQDLFLAGDRVGPNAEQVRHLGQHGGRHLAGDWNGDGKTDLVFVRANPEGGLSWAIDTNGDGKADAEHRVGLAGDTPFLGDWNGDRTIDVGVARKNPQSGALDWYLDTTRQVYANPRARQFGLAADAPVVGDWDGNGTTDLGVTRRDAATGLVQWSLDTSGDAWPETVRGFGLVSTNDVPVAGDWNGDGRTDLGVTRNNAATGLKEWYLDTNGDPFADITQAFGFIRDTPVVGAWKTLAPLVVAPPPPVSNPPIVVARPTATSPPLPPANTPNTSPASQVSRPATPVQPSTAKMGFDVKFLDGSRAVPSGITVTVYDDRGQAKLTSKTDIYGKVDFLGLSLSRYRAIADFTDDKGRWFQGHWDFEGRVSYPNAGRVTWSIWVQEVVKPASTTPGKGGNTITANVKDLQDSKTVPGVRVQLLDGNRNVIETYRSNSLGQVSFRQLGTGRFYVEAFDTSKNRWVSATAAAHTTFDREHGRAWSPKIQVGAVATPNPPPLSGNLKPGVYVAARDLDIARGAVNGLTHQYVILIPANPDDFKGANVRDLGDGTRGIVIAAHNIDGKLQVRTFNHADLTATQQYLDPEKYTAPLIADYDPQVAPVNLSGLRIDDTIRKILNARDHYVRYAQSHPLTYPSLPEQRVPKVINSNSWAQSIIEYTVGRGRVLENFDGFDPGHQNRIPRNYFIG